jgi:FixJ family two-component response regulator
MRLWEHDGSDSRPIRQYGVRKMPRPSAKLIAIIDDNEAVHNSLRDLIEAAGLEARCFESAKAFLDSELHSQAAILIVDIRMPKMSGLELQAKLKEEKCKAPIIFITAFEDDELRAQAMQEGAVDFLAKPIDHRYLLKILRTSLGATDR